MKRLWACYAPYYSTLTFVIIGSVLSAGMEISFPMIVRYILETILPAGNMTQLLYMAVILFSLYAACLCISFGVSYWGRSMGTRIEHDLRCRLFAHIETMPKPVNCCHELLVIFLRLVIWFFRCRTL